MYPDPTLYTRHYFLQIKYKYPCFIWVTKVANGLKNAYMSSLTFQPGKHTGVLPTTLPGMPMSVVRTITTWMLMLQTIRHYTSVWLWPHETTYVHTVVWKIFVWNYFIVENVRENNFRGLPIPTKIQ